MKIPTIRPTKNENPAENRNLCLVVAVEINKYRFTIYKVHKASKKKREKTSAKKERKATKTLAIVLGKFYTKVKLRK